MHRYTLLFVGLALFSYSQSLLFTHALGSKTQIVDIGFALLPHIQHAPGWAGDIVPFTLLVLFLFGVLMSNKLRRAFFLHHVPNLCKLMIWRACLSAVTVLPPSDPSCSVEGDALFWLHGGCHDKIFSGHIAYATYIARVIGDAHPRYRPLIYVAVFLNGVWMIATRAHYTVDCILAVYFAINVVSVKV